jgi:hypothetical protein
MLFRNCVLPIATVIFVGSISFADSVKGTLTVGGKVIELNKIYIEFVEDPNREGKQFVMLRLSDVELQNNKKSVLREQAEAGKLNLVELIFGDDKKITTLLILSNAFEEGSYYSGEIEKEPQNITIGPDTVKGTLAKKGEAPPGQSWEVKADIEVALPDPSLR